MKIRHLAALLALIAVLIACGSSTPNPSQTGLWDQSNFESATWN